MKLIEDIFSNGPFYPRTHESRYSSILLFSFHWQCISVWFFSFPSYHIIIFLFLTLLLSSKRQPSLIQAIVLSIFFQCLYWCGLPTPNHPISWGVLFSFNNLVLHFNSRHWPQTGSHDSLLQSWAVHHQQAKIFTQHSIVLLSRSDVKIPPCNTITFSPTQHSIYLPK